MTSTIIIFKKVKDFHETWYDILPQVLERKDGMTNTVCSVGIGFTNNTGSCNSSTSGVRVSTHGETVPGGSTNFHCGQYSSSSGVDTYFCRLHDPWWEMRKWCIYLCEDSTLRHRQEDLSNEVWIKRQTKEKQYRPEVPSKSSHVRRIL